MADRFLKWQELPPRQMDAFKAGLALLMQAADYDGTASVNIRAFVNDEKRGTLISLDLYLPSAAKQTKKGKG